MLTSNLDGVNSRYSAQDAGKADLNPNNHQSQLKTTRNGNSDSMYTDSVSMFDQICIHRIKKRRVLLDSPQSNVQNIFADFTRRKFTTP